MKAGPDTGLGPLPQPEPGRHAGTSRGSPPGRPARRHRSAARRTPASAVRSGTRNHMGCRWRRSGAGGSNGATRSHRSSGTRSARPRTPCRPRSSSTRPPVSHRDASAGLASFAGSCAQPEAPSSGRWADACARGYRRPGPGEPNRPRPSIASPHCPVPPTDRQAPDRPRPEGPWRTRPPRRVSTMPEHRKRFSHPAVTPRRRLIAPTETARSERARRGRRDAR